MTIIACVLFIIPLVIYSITPELRSDFHGKACIAMLVIQLCIIILLPMINIVRMYSFGHRVMLEAILAFAAYSSSFCTTMICYDIHFTFKYVLVPSYNCEIMFVIFFRNFRTTGINRREYWKFLLYLTFTIFAFVFAFLFYQDRFSSVFESMLIGMFVTIFLLFIVMFVICVYMMVSTFFIMMSLMKSIDTSENTRFDLERERYVCSIFHSFHF